MNKDRDGTEGNPGEDDSPGPVPKGNVSLRIAAEKRAERLRAELRANLARRKLQARARREGAEDDRPGALLGDGALTAAGGDGVAGDNRGKSRAGEDADTGQSVRHGKRQAGETGDDATRRGRTDQSGETSESGETGEPQ